MTATTDRLHRLPVPDGEIAYRDDGSGPLVVLLHGGGLDGREWGAVAADLARDHRVVVPDARGHGRSSTPKGPFRFADDIAALVAHLGVGPAVLAGVSMGAASAVDAALERPEAVRAVVVSGAGTGEPTFGDAWSLQVQAETAAAMAAGDPDAWVEVQLQYVAGPGRSVADVDPAIVAEVRTMLSETLHAHVLPALVAGADPMPFTPVTGTWERLPGLAIPCRAVIGAGDAEDHIAMARRFVAAVPGADEVVVPGAAHYPDLERPAVVAGAVRDLVGRLA